MSDTQETTADIIAEMRTKAECAKPYDDGIVMMLTDYADRLEAAHKREMSKNASKNGADFGQLGDCAKLREALTKVKEWMERRIVTCGYEFSATLPTMLEDVVLPALAAPPRNCDVGTAEDVAKAWHALHSVVCAECVFKRGKACAPGGVCSIGWLLAPATKKKGGTKC